MMKIKLERVDAPANEKQIIAMEDAIDGVCGGQDAEAVLNALIRTICRGVSSMCRNDQDFEQYVIEISATMLAHRALLKKHLNGKGEE